LRDNGPEELMMTQLAHVEIGPSQEIDLLVVMRNHRDATADLRLFDVAYAIPLLCPMGVTRGSGRNNGRGPIFAQV